MSELATIPQEEIRERNAEITDRKRIGNARSWAEAWIDERQLDYTSFSRTLGLGTSGRGLVSKFVRGQIDGDPTRIVLAVEQYRAAVEGPDGISQVIGFRETGCALRIWAYADAAREGHRMAAVIGYTGYGKSEALKQYQRRKSKDGKPPIRILICNVLTNAPFLARQLALEMGLVERGGEPAMCLELVRRRLISNPEFLIVDEANCLQERCLHVLRYLHDTTGTGILLAGTPIFIGMVNNRSNGVGPFPSSEQEKGRPFDGPLALFADRIFTEVLPGVTEEETVEITEDVLRAELTEEATSKLAFYVNHNMRLLTRMILAMREMRKRSGSKKIDEKMVEAAWHKLTHMTQ